MTARAAAAAVVVAFAAVTLVACAAIPTRPADFDRQPTADDNIPPGAVDANPDLNASSSRYVGADSDGDKYWVALPTQDAGTSLCVIYQPAKEEAKTACGVPPVTITTTAGKVIALTSEPPSPGPGEKTIGDTLLVRD